MKVFSQLLLAASALLAFSWGPEAKAEYGSDPGRKVDAVIPTDFVSGGTASHGAGEKEAETAVYQVPLKDLWSKELYESLKQSGVDRLAVQSEGVNTSLRTWAEIQAHAITGKGSLKTEDGERIPALYLALGMVYENQLWVRAPILPLESPVLGKLFEMPHGKGVRVAPTAIMKNKTARTLVMAASTDNQPQLAGLSDAEKKELRQFASRLAYFLNLPGELRLVPMTGQPELWIAPIHLTRPELLHNADLAGQVRAINQTVEPFASTVALDQALRSSFASRSAAQLSEAVGRAVTALEQAPGYMPATLLHLDWMKSRVRPFQLASYVFLLSFLAFLAYLVASKTNSPKLPHEATDTDAAAARTRTGPTANFADAAAASVALPSLGPPSLTLAGAGSASLSVTLPQQPAFFRRTTETVDTVTAAEIETKQGPAWLWGLSYALLLVGTLFLVGAIASRFLLGGRMPVSNMYEAVTFCLGSFAIIAAIAEGWNRRGWIGLCGGFFGWTLMMAVNMMPMHQRKVEPLIAVLDSIWLNYHVTALLVSYACFLLAFGASVIQLVKLRTGNLPGLLPRAEVFENVAFRATQVGWPLLTFGIFLGAVWANTAWGSYWSWDPKETWALITWFGYTIYLHMRMILGWRDHRAGWVNVVGFILVLMTFFGVSYLPGISGGMHSYANPISR